MKCLYAKNKESAMLWHRRLGHINYQSLKNMRDGAVSGIAFEDDEEIMNCKICPIRKQSRLAKKGVNEDGTPKQRMVIDYKKINEHTISEKYPIPDVNVILSNLRKAKVFSTIDLESGFHQIQMKESDIKKQHFR